MFENINKEKYDDMCAALSLPSTNTPSALNAVLSGITVQSDEYQAGDRFWLKPQTHSKCSPRQEYPRSNISSQNQREFQGGFSHFLRELEYSFPHFFQRVRGTLYTFSRSKVDNRYGLRRFEL